MKRKGIYSFISAALVSMLLIGCSTEPQKSETNPTPPESSSAENNEKTEKIYLKTGDVKEFNDWTQVSKYTGDVDGDGEDENVILKTSAQRSQSGEIEWNDGQNWALYVEDGTQSYILFNEYVQLGNVYFEVSDYYMKDDTEPRINVFVSTGAGLKIKNIGFDKEKDCYFEETIYDTKDITDGGINKKFSSIPNLK